MMAKVFSFFLLLFSSVNLLAAELGLLNPENLESMQKQQQALVVDIRTAKEWQATGIIPQSQPVEFFDEQGHYDLEKWLAHIKQLQKSPEQPLILVCRSGNRSGKLGNMLTKQLDMKNVYHLSSGMMSWIKADKAIEKYSNP
jgi:rhodanese-related sulfurtransferase